MERLLVTGVRSAFAPMPSGTCSPAGSWVTAVIYSALPARPRGLCWLSLVPQPVQANSKAQRWLRPRAEKAMAFPLGPAVIICLPSIVNPDAVGGGGKGGGVGGGWLGGTRTMQLYLYTYRAPISDHHTVFSLRTMSPTDSRSVVRLLCADSFLWSFLFNIHNQ